MSLIRSKIFFIATVVTALASGTALGQSLVGRNSNVVGPTPDGFYRGIPHYQDNEARCDRNPLLPSNIVCVAHGYGGADDVIGDAWPRIFETQDNARTWLSRYATGSAADPTTDLGLGFGADPITLCWPGACGGFFIASIRAPGGGTGGGVFLQLMPEFNVETGFRHFSEAGPRTVQLGTGDNFLDKINAIYLLDTKNPGTVEVTMTVEKGNGITEVVTREWPRARIIVVYAALNSSSQNVRIFSTYTDTYGAHWSPPRQVANTTGLDTGVAIAAIDDTVVYAFRQFKDDSGDQLDAVFAAISATRGQTLRKPFVVVDNICPNDQPTLPVSLDPDPPPFQTVASRTNSFVDLSSDDEHFVMVLAQHKLDPSGGCLTRPFDYPSGSRVSVLTAGSNGKNWSDPVEIAPRNDPALPRNGHSFQFMPAIDCVLGHCLSIWYDSINDSIRNISFLESADKIDAVDAFVNFPLFGDFYFPRNGVSGPEILQFKRTVDVFARQFKIKPGGGVEFLDPEPVRLSKFQLFATSPSTVIEVGKIPFGLKQYKGNTVSFMSDYLGIASAKVRGGPDPLDLTAPPVYESNKGPDPDNPQLKPSWFPHWTDTRNAFGQLYTENIDEAVPFEKTGMSGLMGFENPAPDTESEPAPLAGGRKLSAEGVEDSNVGAFFCAPPLSPPDAPGEMLFAADNQNRIKDTDIFGALVEVPATAWVVNTSKGLGKIDIFGNVLQRTYAIAARNELRDAGKKFRFRIMNQPVGFLNNEARASWLQLPFANFDHTNEMDDPLEEIDENVGPLSSVTVALFVVSTSPVNPVTVNVYEVDALGAEQLVATLTVNGALEAGDLVSPNVSLPDINETETHNPFVFSPTHSENVDYSNPEIWNPEIWNPEIWNPEIWNPEIWNPEIWNPEIWNPEIWNPEIWNPEIWNPEIWNVSLQDADKFDNPEIPSPDLSELEHSTGELRQENELVAKFDVLFAAVNTGNTSTPFVADFAVNSALVRELLANNKVKVQIIVWENSELDSFQACDVDLTAGEHRILAVVNNPDLLNLKIPDIMNNRFGSVTYYSEPSNVEPGNTGPSNAVRITVRFVSFEDTIRIIAPELANGGISYVVTSQAANTGESDLAANREQAIGDFIPPSLSVDSGDTVVIQATSPQGAILPADLVTATKGEFETPAVSCTPIDLGQQAPLGPTDLLCSATADNLVSASADITADVQDLDSPELDLTTMPNDITLPREMSDGTFFDYVLPTVSDLIDVNVTAECTPIAPGGTALFTAPGPTTTEITCKAVDAAGESATASFFVTVADTIAPALTIPVSAGAEASNLAGASVMFDPLPSATDIGSVSVSCALFDDPTVTVVSGDQFPIGVTSVECTATDDAGLSTPGQFMVTVADTTLPTFATVVADIAAEANAIGGANVSFTLPTATDLGSPIDVNCDADPAGAFYPLDPTPTTVTCTTVPDAGNLTASTSFIVTAVDTTPPVLTVPSDITVLFGANVTFVATAMDIADASPVVTCDPASGSAFPLGTTTVNCTATDAAAFSDNASFNVFVTLGAGSGLSSNKRSVKAGSVASFNWIWVDFSGNPVDVGEGNQDIEARLGTCANPLGADILDEDPGSSDMRRSGDGWTFNWQTVGDGEIPIETGTYCVSVLLTTTNPPQVQSTEIKVRQ